MAEILQYMLTAYNFRHFCPKLYRCTAVPLYRCTDFRHFCLKSKTVQRYGGQNTYPPINMNLKVVNTEEIVII